jgi:hypothetical protein
MFMIWQQTGSQILDTNGRPDFTSPKFTAFVKKWLAWQKTNAFSTWDWGNFSALLANGTLASYISPDWWIPQVDEAAKRYKFKVRDLPMYSGGSPTTASWGGTFLAIPKGTENPDQIFSIIEAMQYDKDAMIVRWEKTCMLPPMANIWDHPAFKKADSRFGGQPLGSIMVSSALDLPKINTGDVFWDAISDFAGEYTEMATGKKSVEDGLVATQTKAMNRIEK